MSIGTVVALMRGGVLEILLLASPILFTALIVGLIVAIIQATTSIQEQTLTFVPKIIAILGMLSLLGGWMFTSLREYTQSIFELIPQMVR